jgi:predicted DNA-binding transcriptional regulator YafY
MARGDQLARQWKIIQALIASRRGKAVPELAQMVECHTRTVYRDLEALQAAGFPVATERDGHRMVWSLLEPSRHSVPIPFSLPELMALYFGRSMVRPLQGTVFHDALESLFEKIKATLPPEAARFLQGIEAGISVGPSPRKDYGKSRPTIEVLNQAMAGRRVVDVAYRAMRNPKTTRRRVAPYRLMFFDGTFYLVGHCRLRGDIRVFALDRILRIALTEELFAPPQGNDLEGFLASSFGVFQGPRTRVEIRFAAEIAGYIAEKTWHPSQKLTRRADGGLVFAAEVAGTEEIKHWILKWGSKAEVLAPESLREEVRREVKALAAVYAPPSPAAAR